MAHKKTVANTPIDPTTPKVKITLGGTDYFLAWDFNALALAENMTGINMLEAMTFQGVGAVKLRALFYAALLKYQPDITLEQAGSLIPLQTEATQLMQALAECYIGATNVEGIAEDRPLMPESTS
jgi:hypothetical protein